MRLCSSGSVNTDVSDVSFDDTYEDSSGNPAQHCTIET
jgi:hypothetical protein